MYVRKVKFICEEANEKDKLNLCLKILFVFTSLKQRLNKLMIFVYQRTQLICTFKNIIKKSICTDNTMQKYYKRFRFLFNLR